MSIELLGQKSSPLVPNNTNINIPCGPEYPAYLYHTQSQEEAYS